MTNIISQEIFDSVVTENKADFEMSENEAIQDAIAQFEAQGINLVNIIKQEKIQDGDTWKHEIEIMVSKLKNISSKLLENAAEDTAYAEDVLAMLSRFKFLCDRSLPERCLAGRCQALAVLNNILAKFLDQSVGQSYKLKIYTLEAIKSLVNLYPDLMDDRLIESLFYICEKTTQDNDSLVHALIILCHCCTMHEANRAKIFKKGIFSIVLEVITRRSDSEYLPVIKAACMVVDSLTLDDDPRVLAGQANERMRIMIDDHKCLKLFTQLSNKYQEHNDILASLYKTLSKLVCRDEFCIEVMELDGMKNLLSVLSSNTKDKTLLQSILLLLKKLSGSDPLKKDFMSYGGAAILLDVINENSQSKAVCQSACLSLAALVLRHPIHVEMFMSAGAAEVLIRVLTLHAGSAAVQKAVSVAIRNLISRNPEFIATFLEGGAEELLREAMVRHPASAEEIKSALRDLQCKVDLKESWKGTGKEIEQ